MEHDEELITNAINNITEKISQVLLQEFLKLQKELQLNIVLIKSAQLLLANVLCHVVASKDELDKIIDDQGAEIKDLTINCFFTGFSDKFNVNKH
jgi:hypothetical protein